MAVDTAGVLYVADIDNATIRKITPDGNVTTLAGSAGNIGSNDGTGSAARFNVPSGVAVDANGVVYVSEVGNSTIRKITAGGVVTTLAGLAGSKGSTDGTGTAARFSSPRGLAVDDSGNIYVVDSGNHTIRKISPAGVVATFAGVAGASGAVDGTGSSARFKSPTGLAIDRSGNLYVCDGGNFTIRKITPSGTVTTLAGLAGSAGHVDATGAVARFQLAVGIAVDSSNTAYVSDGDQTVRKISGTGDVTTVAGVTNVQGSADGVGLGATFKGPLGIAVDGSGNLYVADSGNATVRLGVFPLAQSNYATPYFFTTLAGTAGTAGSADGTGAAAQFASPGNLAVDSAGVVYVPDATNHVIRKITPFGVVVTFAGSPGVQGKADGAGNSARFNSPRGVALDASGNVFVADANNHAIRKITPGGAVTTFAGVLGVAGTADGTGTSAQFNAPNAVAIDASGNLYVADTNNLTIRKITVAGVVTTFAGAAGQDGTQDGTGSAARFGLPLGIAVDRSGNVYVADGSYGTIRKITAAGVVTTFAGKAGVLGGFDAVGTAATLRAPSSVAVDAAGNVYVTDLSNDTIRKITSAGVVTTLGGVSLVGGNNDGSGSTARFSSPKGIGVDGSGNLYVSDTANFTVRMSVTPPAFTTHPVSQSITPGATATFTVATTSNAPVTLEWSKDGVIIPGATTTTLNVVNAQASNLGTYSVAATNVSGTTTSNPAVLSFVALPAFTNQPASQSVAPGGTATFAATVGGSTATTFQWLKDGAAIAGATGTTLTVNNVQAINLGNYTVIATNSAGSTVSSLAVLSFAGSNLGHLVNISIRSNAGTGAQTLIVGFVLGGTGTTGTKALLIRGAGPSLSGFGVSGVLSDPNLNVLSGTTTVASNDNWSGDAQVSSVGGAVGAFPFAASSSKDAALVASALNSGAYTAQITGVGNTTGIALAEVYDATPTGSFTASTPRLINVSARTEVGTGADILIAGFVIAGSTPKTLLIRAVGQTLSGLGVAGVLADPKLEVYSGNTLQQANDNWGGDATIASVSASVGAFALDRASKDAVLLLTLSPGTYTAQVSGVGGTTGVALVEVYEVP